MGWRPVRCNDLKEKMNLSGGLTYQRVLVKAIKIATLPILIACTDRASKETVIESGQEVTIRNFSDTENKVSFDYPSNWQIQKPQRKSTLILLYELNGSEATCNLSIVDQDKNQI